MEISSIGNNVTHTIEVNKANTNYSIIINGILTRVVESNSTGWLKFYWNKWNETEIFEITPANSVHSFSFDLHEGWNLISLPLISNYSASSLISAIGENAKHIVGRDTTTGEYKSYTAGFSSLENDFQIQPDLGYYVYLSNNTSLSVHGILPGERNVNLSRGWNLVGWPSLNTSNVTIAFIKPLTENVKYVTLRDEITGEYVTYIPFFSEKDLPVKPGHGYFIFVNSNCTLYYNNK
jgi:hypothetical protein